MKSLTTRAPFLASPVLLAFAALAALIVLAEIRSTGFLSLNHVGVILGIAAVLGIAGAGQTFVIVAAGIDLSVGAIISAADVFTVQWTAGSDFPLLVVAAIVILGAIMGAINGLGVSYLGINPMVMTLGMASVVGGLALVVTDGQSGGSPHRVISDAMTTKFFGMPGTVFVWIIVAVIALVVLRFTELGRNIYAFGSNPKAAEIAGLRRGATLVRVYAIAGGCSAIAGVVLAGYTGTGAYGIGDQYTLMSVAAVVIGGASILGGRGSYAGTIAGVITLVVLDDVLSAAAVPVAGRQIVQGVAILLILVIYGRERGMRTTS